MTGSVRLVGADGDKYKPLDSARLLSEVHLLRSLAPARGLERHAGEHDPGDEQQRAEQVEEQSDVFHGWQLGGSRSVVDLVAAHHSALHVVGDVAVVEPLAGVVLGVFDGERGRRAEDL